MLADLDHVADRLQRRRPRAGVRALGDGDRARLPVEQGDQLRHRLHGPDRFGPARPAHRPVRRSLLDRARDRPRRRGRVRGDHRTRGRAAALHGAPGDPAGGDHRREPSSARRSCSPSPTSTIHAPGTRCRSTASSSSEISGSSRRSSPWSSSYPSSRSGSAGSSTARCSAAPCGRRR